MERITLCFKVQFMASGFPKIKAGVVQVFSLFEGLKFAGGLGFREAEVCSQSLGSGEDFVILGIPGSRGLRLYGRLRRPLIEVPEHTCRKDPNRPCYRLTRDATEACACYFCKPGTKRKHP